MADELVSAGADVTIIELNTQTIQRQQGLGRHIIHGDVVDPEVLRQADIMHADALVLTIPDEDEALKACREARKLSPHLFIAARTNFVSKGILASQAGANAVVVEELVTAAAMQQAVMQGLNHHGQS